MHPNLLEFYEKELKIVQGERKKKQQQLYRHLHRLDVSERMKEKTENEQRYISELPSLTIGQTRTLLLENERALQSSQITIVEKNDLMRYQRRLAVMFYKNVVHVLKKIIDFLKKTTTHPETPVTKKIHQYLIRLRDVLTIHRAKYPELLLSDIYNQSKKEFILDNITSLLTPPSATATTIPLPQQVPRTPPAVSSSSNNKQPPSAPVKRKRSDSTQQQL